MRKFLAGARSPATAFFAGNPAHADQPVPWEIDASSRRHRHDAADRVVRELHDVVHRPDHAAGAVSARLLHLSSSARASTRFPRKTSHNTLIEVIWTVGPVVILLFIAIPSFQLLTAQYTPPEEAKLTIKATGNQWNWDYEYQIDNTLSFNSAMLAGWGPRRRRQGRSRRSIRGCSPSTTSWSCRSTP